MKSKGVEAKVPIAQNVNNLVCAICRAPLPQPGYRACCLKCLNIVARRIRNEEWLAEERKLPKNKGKTDKELLNG